MRVILFALLSLAACTDAAKTEQSSANQNEGSVCTGNLYDGCTTDDACSSGLCKLYSNRMVQVCTQTCSATNPCPDQNGKPAWCNNMGFCRPDTANVCEPQ